MSERLAELREKVGATRRRLEEAVRRLAALRARLRQDPDDGHGNGDGDGRAAGTGSGSEGASAPLFAGLVGPSGSLQDLELHFEALDTEDPKREER